MLGTVQKQPADQRDYDVDFSRWIPDGDEITTAVTTVDPAFDAALEPAGLSVESVHVATPIVKVWVKGGISGKTYKITVTASTSGGRVKETEFNIRVRDY